MNKRDRASEIYARLQAERATDNARLLAQALARQRVHAAARPSASATGSSSVKPGGED